MSGQLPALIFDLDGTIIDSKPGILSCLREVLNARGVEAHGPLDRFIGPPVEEWAIELLPDGSEEVRAAFAHDYRSCYDREGWKNSSVFAGVREMLDRLREAGFPLYICTSKRHHFAVRILDAFELTGFFITVYGDKAEYIRHDKADLLATLLRERELSADLAWMIGDRIFDIEAARSNQIRCLAAGWGYGSEEESALADGVAAAPGDIFALLSAQNRDEALDLK
jgi:phosphoglycolate phosphatase